MQPRKDPSNKTQFTQTSALQSCTQLDFSIFLMLSISGAEVTSALRHDSSNDTPQNLLPSSQKPVSSPDIYMSPALEALRLKV